MMPFLLHLSDCSTNLVELEAALEELLRLLQLSKVEAAHAHVVAGDVVLSGHAAKGYGRGPTEPIGLMKINRNHGTYVLLLWSNARRVGT